jgi:hypothetical protein
MDSKILRQFNRIAISVKDLDRCLEFAKAAKFARKLEVKRGLITATIIAYARPFSANENHDFAIPTPSLKILKLSKSELELHHHLCDLRNKAIAHSDFELNPINPVDQMDKGFTISGFYYDPLREIAKITQIFDLATKVQKSLINRLFELNSIRMSPKA